MSTHKRSYGNPETGERILQAAWQLIEEEGAGFRLVDVAERAGVSRQALYLHFGDRSGLLVALVDYIDIGQGWADERAYIFGASTAVETLRRWVEVMSRFTARIDQVTEVIETNQYEDEAMSAAWRDRMRGRQALVLAIMERIAAEGRLASDWSAADAADVVYVYTMPGPWRELTRELGWSVEKFDETIWRVLSSSLLVDGP